MRVAILGGNGFIGREITRQLAGRGHEVSWLSHRPGRVRPPSGVSEVPLSLAPGTPASGAIAGSDAVVNVSGYPIATRWNAHVKELIEESRVGVTCDLVDAIGRARSGGLGPSTLVNACACGIYGDAGDDVLSEESPTGGDWLADLAVKWDDAARWAEDLGVRTVRIRNGIVMGSEGVLPRMLLAMKLFVGGPIGTGRQWVPWVHRADIAGLYVHAVENDAVEGALNGGAPNPLRMRDLAAALGRAVDRPSWATVPEPVVRVILGEAAPYTLESQRMSADKAIASGYEFRFTAAEKAFRDLIPLKRD